MSTYTPSRTTVYPESDGLPIAENTLQFEWITKLVGGLEALYREDPEVFVAGDLFWYPIERDNTTRVAPDAMVAFGRPKGHRGSYMQWLEAGIAPQVVFEVRSPGNRFGEMARKLAFYDRFDVEEYYLVNPDVSSLEGWRRVDDVFREIPELNGWVSPRLGIRFEVLDDGLHITRPDGRPFETYAEVVQRAEEERRRADRLVEKLRALGVDPDA